MQGRGAFTALLVLVLLSSGSTAPAAGLLDSSWPAFRHDCLHTGRCAVPGPASASAGWSCALGGAGLSSPAVGGGLIYAAGGGSLTAASRTGSVVWAAPCGSSGMSSPAVAADGAIYVASADTYLYAFALDGALKWKKSVQAPAEASPTVGPDGRVYVGSNSGKFFCFGSDGSQKYVYTAGGAIGSSAAVGSDGTAYFGCDDGCLYAIRSNGTLKWKFATSPATSIKSSPSVGSDGSIYFGTMGGLFYAVNSAGTQKWRYTAGGPVFSSPAVAADGALVFGCRDHHLYCLNPVGSLRWKTRLGGYVDSSPAIDADGVAYVGCNDGLVYAIRPDGGAAWSVALGSGVVSSPAIDADGSIYVLSYDGSLRVIGSDPTPPPAPVVTDGGAYSGSPTTLSASWGCVDPESGIARYEYAIGTLPGAQDLVPFTDAGTATGVTHDDLALTNGADYFFAVRAVNGAGLVSPVGVSDGIRVDFTPPAVPVVADEGEYTMNPNSLRVLFSSGDPESGIQRYEYSVGTAAGLNDVLPWTDSGLVRDVTITCLNLSHGVFYYINIRATNRAGLTSTGTSNGIKVDLTAPDVTGATARFVSQEIRAAVAASDPESGVIKVECALLTSPELPASPNWIAGIPGQEIAIPGPLSPTESYHIAARATNGAGALSAVSVSGRIVWDETPPAAPLVTDSGAYSSDPTTLQASWAASDPESGIDHCTYCIGTSPGVANVVPWTDTKATSAVCTGLALADGVTYYFTVRAVNGAGLASAPGHSDGITIDTTPPTRPTVTDDGEFTTVRDCLRVSFTSSDPESGILRYACCVGTSPGADNIAAYASVEGLGFAYVCGLNLQAGMRYYVSVRALNGSGLWGQPGTSDGIEYVPGVLVWPKFRSDARNTGKASVRAPSTANLHWRIQTQGYVESSAAIGRDGTAYIGSSDGKLYAISPSGAVRWAYQTGSCIDSSPAVDADGRIYVGSYDGSLYCLQHDGSLLWKFAAGGMIWSSPAIGADGTIYFGCQDHRLYALNPNGSEKWRYTAGGSVWSSPALADDGTVYFGCGDGKLYALSSSGGLKWTWQTGSAVDSSPAVGEDGAVYFGSGDGHLYALRADGSQRWRVYLGLLADSSPAVTPDGRVYVGTGGSGHPGGLYAYTDSGEKLWFLPFSRGVRSSPAVGHDGNICFGTGNGTVHMVDPTGKTLWTYDTGESVLSSPALGLNGTLIVGSDDGGIYCFRDHTLIDVSPPSAPDVRVERAFVTPDMSISVSWSAFDPESGIHSYSYAIGTQPGTDDVVSWTAAGLSTSAVRSNLPLLPGRSYYVSVVARNNAMLVSEPGVSNAVVVVSGDPAKTIGGAKTRLPGTQVTLPGKVVTAVFGDCVFVEEPDRSSGIRCAGPTSGLQAGMVVDIQGTVGSHYGEVVLTGAVFTQTGCTGQVRPLGLPCESFSRIGLSVEGMLVRVAGRVDRTGSGYFVLYDGSHVLSPRGGMGTEIWVESGSSGPALGSYVAVTGIACRELAGSRVATVIRALPGSGAMLYADGL